MGLRLWHTVVHFVKRREGECWSLKLHTSVYEPPPEGKKENVHLRDDHEFQWL